MIILLALVAALSMASAPARAFHDTEAWMGAEYTPAAAPGNGFWWQWYEDYEPSVERELACVSESETLEADVSEGTYYVWVEGSSASYTLDVQAFPTCSDQCGPVGDVVCLDETTARECGQYDADSCLDFGPRTTCADGETCIPGEGCGVACEAGACVVGETRCGADGVVEVCTEICTLPCSST